ncbi:MAG: hypothetical protein IPM35_17130 [Myxococcales bacterium]|nr:hypothetical protein [Myxococcales bacterium]
MKAILTEHEEELRRATRRLERTKKSRAERKRDFARWLKERGIRLGSDDDTDARYGG